MRTCSKCMAELPVSEFGKKRKSKDGLDYVCKTCNVARVSEWRAKNPSRRQEYSARYYSNTQVIAREKNAEYRAKNSIRLNAAKIEWQRANKERYHANHKAWRDKNKVKVAQWVKATQRNSDVSGAYKAAKRRSIKLRATPAWCDFLEVRWFYSTAKFLNTFDIVRYDVDHIVPLVSPIVCGLHNQFNLQILPARTNKEKGNRHWPDMP